MPLLSPNQIQKVLHQSGLHRSDSEISEIAELLNNSHLTKEDVIACLGEVMRGADQSSTRLKAAEIAMKLHGMLHKDEGATVPIVNIIIKDSDNQINPILIPRGQ